MILRKRGLLIIFTVLYSTAFMPTGDEENTYIDNKQVAPPFLTYMQEKWVDSVMATLNLDKQIGQLLMVAAYSNRGEAHKDHVTGLIKKYGVGGLVFFQGGPHRQAKLTNHFQENSEVPLLIAMDAEWGLGMRLDSTISYPKQMMLGAIEDELLLYEMGADIAKQCRRLGVHINFAPVVDINTDPQNPVINTRSFGENKHEVTRKALAYMRGMQDNDVLATAKHFPGHGDTKTDSHKALPVINKSEKELDTLELHPFKALIGQGVSSVMIAHLSIPALDPAGNTASSLSQPIIEGLLKNSLGFEGLVVSDALNMKGVSDYFSPGDLEVKALKAGNDIILMPDDVPKAIRHIKRAVRHGEITEKVIAHRCRKVLSAKYWAGLNDYQLVKMDSLYEDLNAPVYKYTYRKLTEAALSLVKNNNNLIPLKSIDTLQMASLVIGCKDISQFQSSLDLYAGIDHYCLPADYSQDEFDAVFRKLVDYDLTLLGIIAEHPYPSSFGIQHAVAERFNVFSDNHNSILVLFGNPYALHNFNTSDYQSVLVAYDDHPVIQDYAGQLLFGGIPAKGRLPVTASESFIAGSSIKTEKIRLKYSVPEEVNANRTMLAKADSIINEAINIKATPGCQVLAAKDGVVFFHSAAGHHTYQHKIPVNHFDLYDLASVTKIIATLPVIMHLQEEGQFDIDNELSDYLETLTNTNKESLVIKDILAHQGRLKPWIPFYRKYIELLEEGEHIFSRTFNYDHPFILDKHLFLNRNYKFRDGIFSFGQDDQYRIKVADHFYMNEAYIDTMYSMITESGLLDEKKYAYSDLGYYYLYRIIENIIQKPVEQYVNDQYYAPLGMNRTSYLPLQRYSKRMIIPTQNDNIFRKQLVHGHVHDPGAAMMGGVCGHAGVFSNANDMAKMMQMYINGGVYGGTRFFDTTSINFFTSAPFMDNDNRRGIGFDKPEPDPDKIGPTCRCLSLKSFGHTGFTGTMVWADPVENIVYVFLSNRIHPDEENLLLVKEDIRTEIQKMIYKSLDIDSGVIKYDD